MSETPESPSTWPHVKFAAYLDDVLRAAGVRENKRTGQPRLAGFEDLTGISGSQLKRWREGSFRPSTGSLRQIADTLADLIDMPPGDLYANLMRAAGYTAEPPQQGREHDPLAAIGRLYDDAGTEDREWILAKLADVQEQIEMRLKLSRRAQHGS